MSEALIGVLVGGIIASIAPIAQLIYNHFHWKRETKLAYLKEERLRLERKNNEVLEMVNNALLNEMVSNKLACELLVHLPKSVVNLYQGYISRNDKSDKAKNELFFDITIELGKTVADVDEQIKKLLE